MPLRQSDSTKKGSSPNLAEFTRLYGNKATHLNALLTTKHKPHLKKILKDAINEHWDEEIYQEMIEEYEVEPNLMPEDSSNT